MNNSSNIDGAHKKGSVHFYQAGSGFKLIAYKLAVFILFFNLSSAELGAQAKTETDDGEPAGKQAQSYSSTNFDGRMLAGSNGDSMFSVSMTQGVDNFAYQLNSNSSNNNDFGNYNNSSFTAQQTGFTGEITLLDYWKIIPEFEIKNSSYGMFDNPFFSRENNDKTRLRLKSEYKPVPARWEIDLNYARYDHSLKETDTSSVGDDTYYSLKGIVGMEYIWSASNKFGLRTDNGLNRYPDQYEDDSYSNNELYASFKVTEYTMLTLTPMLCWNRDESDFLYFKGNISTINIKYVSLELLHEYKLVSYKPEEVVYSKKYMSNIYDLPPATINHSELRGEFDSDTQVSPDSLFGIKRAGLRLIGIYEDNNNFYNYYPLDEGILSAEAIPANFLNGRMEFVTTLVLLTQVIDVQFKYDYFRYSTRDSFEDVNITYRPESTFSCDLSYAGSWLEIDWANSYWGSVYVDPDEERKLKGSILGTLDVHLKLYDTLYFHSRINNLYNEKYSLREGYPEPGVQYFAGLRVII